MRRIKLLCAIGMILGSTFAAASQATGAATLSADLRSHLEKERFQIVTSIRGLPLGVRDMLQTMFGSGGLDIANPGNPFQEPGVATDSTLPLRRLIAAGCSGDFHCLVYYERGGTNRTWHVALFHWTPAETRLEWGATAPGNLKTVEDVQKAILSGVLKEPSKLW
jgi:hypothetical protein